MEMEPKKISKTTLIIVIALALSLILGVSYAFLASIIDDGASGDVVIEAEDLDKLIFNVDHDLNFTLTQFNLTDGGDNIGDTSVASASLKANKNTNNANYNYYVYLNIVNNEFVYTTSEVPKKPEMILTIKDPEGNVLTSLEGLDYVTSGEVTGFDITEVSGLIKVADNYAISSTSSTTATVQNWEFTITFINLDTNQSQNAKKSIVGKIIIQQEPVETLVNHIKGLYTTDGEKGLYLHDADLTNGANDGSYRYAGANPDNFVCFGSEEETCPDDNLYRIIGVFNEINVNNGTIEERVKLIKAYEAGENVLGKTYDFIQAPDATYYKGKLTKIPEYYWGGSSSSNIWSNSTLNTETLNGTYLTKLGEYANKIAKTRLKVGGISTNGITPLVAYQNEVGMPVNNEIYDAKIGLMYLSEYVYAASSENWTVTLYKYKNDSNRNNNWMHLGVHEWTISRASFDPSSAFIVSPAGNMYTYGVKVSGLAVRPTFSLNSSVEFAGGTGTASDPFRIS